MLKRGKSKKCRLAVLAITAVLVTATGCGSSSGVRFGTAAEGGVYHLFSTKFAQVLEDSNVDISARETAGSAANIRLLSQGYIDLGLAQSDLISEMYFGKDFGLDENYRGYSAIAALYPEYVQIVTRKDSEINSLDDLDGCTISVGQDESGTERDAVQILSAYGLDSNNVQELNYNYADAMQHLLAGDIDLMFVTAGTPSEILESNAESIKFLSIEQNKRDRIRTTYDGFVDVVIPAGTYTGQDYDIETVSVSAVLLASDSLSSETVYEVTEALFENQAEIAEAISTELMEPEEAKNVLNIPLHPGAAAWYLDQNMTVEDAEIADTETEDTAEEDAVTDTAGEEATNADN